MKKYLNISFIIAVVMLLAAPVMAKNWPHGGCGCNTGFAHGEVSYDYDANHFDHAGRYNTQARNNGFQEGSISGTSMCAGVNVDQQNYISTQHGDVVVGPVSHNYPGNGEAFAETWGGEELHQSMSGSTSLYGGHFSVSGDQQYRGGANVTVNGNNVESSIRGSVKNTMSGGAIVGSRSDINQGLSRNLGYDRYTYTDNGWTGQSGNLQQHAQQIGGTVGWGKYGSSVGQHAVGNINTNYSSNAHSAHADGSMTQTAGLRFSNNSLGNASAASNSYQQLDNSYQTHVDGGTGWINTGGSATVITYHGGGNKI